MDTLVILMGTRTLEDICNRLIAAGMQDTMPCALVQWANTPHQRVFKGVLRTFASEMKPHAPLTPAIIIVGKVAEYATC